VNAWELLGWLAAVCLALLLVFVTLAIVVGLVKAMFAPAKRGPVGVVLPTGPTPAGGAQPPRSLR
jgi:hypothetical protein